MVKNCIFVLLIALTPLAWSDTNYIGDDFSFYLGEMLPNGIDNVTEILPLIGGRYGLQTSHFGVVDFGLANSHAAGVDFTTLEVSPRGSVTFSPGLEVLYYGGVNFNYYTPVGEDSRRTKTGLHVGSGGMLQITNSIWLRGDLKFMIGPGASLYILGGLLFR